MPFLLPEQPEAPGGIITELEDRVLEETWSRMAGMCRDNRSHETSGPHFPTGNSMEASGIPGIPYTYPCSWDAHACTHVCMRTQGHRRTRSAPQFSSV